MPANIAETAQVEAHSAPSCLSRQLWTINAGRLRTDRTNYTHPFNENVASGNARAFKRHS